MKRAAILAIACAIVALSALAERARADSSQGGAFLLPRYGARAWGMAGAVIARIDDESAVDWNPAGMARASRSGGVSYVELVPGAFLNQSQAVFLTPLGRDRDAETGVARHAAGAMYTNLSADVGAGQTYSENYLRLAYAYSPQPLVTFAFAGQVFLSSSDVTNFDGWGTSVDMAARLALTETWSTALVARDVFSRYSWEDGRDEQKERQYVLGIAHHSPRAIDLEGDFVYEHAGWLRALVGAETHYLFDCVALRAGVALVNVGEARVAYSFGMSVRAAQRFHVHYGAVLDDENALGTTHHFSLGVGW